MAPGNPAGAMAAPTRRQCESVSAREKRRFGIGHMRQAHDSRRRQNAVSAIFWSRNSRNTATRAEFLSASG